MIKEKIRIFLVDDDAVFLKQADFIIEKFPTGERCIDKLYHNPDVIILDYHLDGTDKTAMNGIEVLDKIKAFNSDIAVIMLSSQDKIEVAVNCIHHRAFD